MLTKVLIDNITKNDLISEWGLSFYIEYNGHKLLLDTGSSGNFAENAKKMGIRLEEIEVGVLSHAHYDHADGMPVFFELNKDAKFYLRKGAEENCYGKKNFFRYKYNGIQPGILTTYKERIEYVEGDYQLMEGIYLIPHKTIGLEKIAKKVNLYVKDNGKMFRK
jgi:7,8-dihydropterin-6-yl-methyl-4-(beta-D-ribofuranosyl)aminobenzene 5'-phosphate synthase